MIFHNATGPLQLLCERRIACGASVKLVDLRLGKPILQRVALWGLLWLRHWGKALRRDKVVARLLVADALRCDLLAEHFVPVIVLLLSLVVREVPRRSDLFARLCVGKVAAPRVEERLALRRHHARVRVDAGCKRRAREVLLHEDARLRTLKLRRLHAKLVRLCLSPADFRDAICRVVVKLGRLALQSLVNLVVHAAHFPRPELWYKAVIGRHVVCVVHPSLSVSDQPGANVAVVLVLDGVKLPRGQAAALLRSSDVCLSVVRALDSLLLVAIAAPLDSRTPVIAQWLPLCHNSLLPLVSATRVWWPVQSQPATPA